jgi:hypothetical protein
VRFLATAILIVAAASCENTTCEDLCQEDLDNCLDQAASADAKSDCHSSFDMCIAVCDGRSNSPTE